MCLPGLPHYIFSPSSVCCSSVNAKEGTAADFRNIATTVANQVTRAAQLMTQKHSVSRRTVACGRTRTLTRRAPMAASLHAATRLPLVRSGRSLHVSMRWPASGTPETPLPSEHRLISNSSPQQVDSNRIEMRPQRDRDVHDGAPLALLIALRAMSKIQSDTGHWSLVRNTARNTARRPRAHLRLVSRLGSQSWDRPAAGAARAAPAPPSLTSI